LAYVVLVNTFVASYLLLGYPGLMDVSHCDWNTVPVSGPWPQGSGVLDSAAHHIADFYLQQQQEQVVTEREVLPDSFEERVGPDGEKQCRRLEICRIVKQSAHIFCVQIFEAARRNRIIRKVGKTLTIASGVAMASALAAHGLHHLSQQGEDLIMSVGTASTALGAGTQDISVRMKRKRKAARQAVYSEPIANGLRNISTESIAQPWKSCHSTDGRHQVCH
jgi:hypothetical protein